MVGLTLLATAGAAASTGLPQMAIQSRAADKAEDKQKRANRVAKASSQVENARQRRKAIAQSRIVQAQNIANQGQNVQGSSGLAGVQSSLASQLGANFATQRAGVSNQQNIFDLNQQASDALRQGQETSGLVTALGNTMQSGMSMLSGMSGGLGAAKTAPGTALSNSSFGKA